MRVVMSGLSPAQLMGCAPHSHGYWEILILLSGNNVLTVGDREIPCESGTIVCQPPEIPHGNRSETGFQDLWVQVEDFIPPCSDEIPVFHDDKENRFSILLRMLYETFHRSDPNRERIVGALWEALYQILLGWSVRRGGNPLVESLISAMVLNLSDPAFDLAAEIRKTGYCADHFRRCFKRETGLTPTAYLIDLRIRHAQRLLDLPRHGGYTIQEIARRSGFADPYYFSTLYRQKTGHPPSGG